VASSSVLAAVGRRPSSRGRLSETSERAWVFVYHLALRGMMVRDHRADGVEVWVCHGFLGRQPLLVIVPAITSTFTSEAQQPQQPIKKINGLRGHEVLVLRRHKSLPLFPRVSAPIIERYAKERTRTGRG